MEVLEIVFQMHKPDSYRAAHVTCAITNFCLSTTNLQSFWFVEVADVLNLRFPRPLPLSFSMFWEGTTSLNAVAPFRKVETELVKLQNHLQ